MVAERSEGVGEGVGDGSTVTVGVAATVAVGVGVRVITWRVGSGSLVSGPETPIDLNTINAPTTISATSKMPMTAKPSGRMT